MEDPEEKSTLVNNIELNNMTLTICSTPCRIGGVELTMSDLIKTGFSIISLEFICLFAITLMRLENSLIKWLALFHMIPIVFLYLFMYVNLISNGWGAPNSRFWCDVKIMYARGFNTIRTCTSFVSRSIFFVLMSIVLNIGSGTALSLIVLLAVISEWQAGLSENKNQYDVKVHDKFMKNDFLSLEALHYFQFQKKKAQTHYVPFIIHCFIKTYLITSLLSTSGETNTNFTFGWPIVAIIVLYTFLLPTFIDFMHLKDAVTFCQVELYKLILDITLPCIAVCFALV